MNHIKKMRNEFPESQKFQAWEGTMERYLMLEKQINFLIWFNECVKSYNVSTF